MRRGARAAARACGRCRGRARRPTVDQSPTKTVEEPFAAVTGRGAADRRIAVLTALSRLPEGRALARSLSAASPRPLRRSTRRPGAGRSQVWSGRAGEIALGKVDDGTGRDPGGVDGPTGRMGDGARTRRLVRRQGPERVVDLDPAQRRLRPRPHRPCAGSCSWHTLDLLALALLRDLAVVASIRATCSARPRSARRRSPTSSCAPSWIGFRGRAFDPAALLAGLAAGGRRGLPRRPPRRAQLREPAWRHRRRLRGRHRRRPDSRRPGAVRPHARRRHRPVVRAGRLGRRDP